MGLILRKDLTKGKKDSEIDSEKLNGFLVVANLKTWPKLPLPRIGRRRERPHDIPHYAYVTRFSLLHATFFSCGP